MPAKKTKVTSSPKKQHKRTFSLLRDNKILLIIIGIIIMIAALLLLINSSKERQDTRSLAAPAAELQVDKTFQSFTGSQYTSQYHIYASGLDWAKPVGMLMYTDGSGESGLNDPESDYLMAGANGIIAVAKKHNMVLVTPFAPNKNCSDGDGSCWYDGDPEGYAKWAEELITSIESQYQIDKRRVAVGGYSSGATFTTGYWIPSGGAMRTMTDGVLVAISYGGPAYMDEAAYTAEFKANVHMNWNEGDQDGSLPDVQEGYQYYTDKGFDTSLDLLPGVGHSRSGQFGLIMDAMISAYVIPASGDAPTNVPPDAITPTYYCAGSNVCVPSEVPPTEFVPEPTTIAPTTIDANPTTDPGTNPTINPDQNPQPTNINPNPNPNPGGGDDWLKDIDRGGGFWAFVLAILLAFLQFFGSLFG